MPANVRLRSSGFVAGGNSFCGVYGVGRSDEMRCRPNLVLATTVICMCFYSLLSGQATAVIGGVVRVMSLVAAVGHVAQLLQIEHR